MNAQRFRMGKNDVVAFVNPLIDAHSLGIVNASRLMGECGFKVVLGEEEIRSAVSRPDLPGSGRAIKAWIKNNGISVLGFSYRLDPEDGARLFVSLVRLLTATASFCDNGGGIRALFFAGLPDTCALVMERYPAIAGLFNGDETPAQTLDIFGIDRTRLPQSLQVSVVYDEARMAFSSEILRKGDYAGYRPADRSGSRLFGRRGDSVVARIDYGRERAMLPLIRVHAGPYLPDHAEARKLFKSWTRKLAASGLLDVLSIGSSQLSQEAFGESHEGMGDGGGVPIDSPRDYEEIWEAARPMLVRTYAGTKNVERLALMHEETIDIAWHALSFWWFCKIDGRGPNSVFDNIDEHLRTLRTIAASGKPFEPNVPHQFAFRGADDVSYVVSGYLAAKAAKLSGITYLILQTMLNTPKATWGVQDLAKARVLLKLVRTLEDDSFRVFLQPRGGLDYFSPDETTAKTQLAAVTALMDDIEPNRASSPDIIHVVSHSEGRGLATPAIIEESIRITLHALVEYRRQRAAGSVADMSHDEETETRARQLAQEAWTMINAIESSLDSPYSARGLYDILKFGFLSAPYLGACRDEFPGAVSWNTGVVSGSIRVIDPEGRIIPAKERAALCSQRASLSKKTGDIH